MSKDMNGQSYAYTAESGIIPYTSVPNLLKEAAIECPDRNAYIFWTVSGERSSITFSELYTKSEQFAKGLSTLEYVRDSIIAIETRNTPDWLICTFGIQMAGFVPLHFAFSKPTGEDIVRILNNVDKCVALIADSSSIEICKQLVDSLEGSKTIESSQISTLKNIIFMNLEDTGFQGHNDIVQTGQSSKATLPIISADDICAIFLTSGSTGMAKAVPYTHRNILHMGFTWTKLMELESGDRFFSYFPFGWQASYPVTVLTSKVTRVTFTDLRALTSIDEINKLTLIALENDKCVSAVLLAPAICNLIKKENARCKAFPLKVICTAGLPVDSICSTIIGPKANKFAVAYGCTEMGFISVISVDSAFDYESYAAGNPVYGAEVKILDGNGYIVPVGTSGEIYIRIRDRFLGYINAKEKTEHCYDKTGWYKSDDVGFMKLNGCLVVTGRKSDMMIISNELVSPSYLEDIFKKHDCIANAYIFPIHDQKTFQQAGAAILLRKDKVTTAEELDQFIRKQRGNYSDSFLATRHVPKTYLFFDSFPLTHSGKLDRKALMETIKSRLGKQ